MSVTTSTKAWDKCSRSQLLEAVHILIDQRDRQITRADDLTARLAKVEALADEWERDGGAEPFAWEALRAALASDPTHAQDADGGRG